MSMNSTTDPSGPTGAGAAQNSLSRGVRSLQERARELREEGAQIEQIQAGTGKCRRGRRSRASSGCGCGRDEAEEHDAPTQVAAIAAIVTTNGPVRKRKRPRAAQDAS